MGYSDVASSETGAPKAAAEAVTMGSVIDRTEKAVVLALEVSVGALLLIQVFVVFWGAFTRYVLNAQGLWTEELGRTSLIWITFIGGGLASFKMMHIRIDVLYRRLNPGAKAVFDSLGIALTIAFICALWGPSLALVESRSVVISPSLGVPESVLFVVPLVIGLGIMLLYEVFHLLRLRRDHIVLSLAFLAALVVAGTALQPLAKQVIGQVNSFALLFTVFCVLLALHVPLAFALGMVSSAYLLLAGTLPAPIVPQRIATAVNSFVFLAVPLFIFTGAIMETGGISKRIADFAMALVGHLRGGLALVVLVTTYLFSGISGSTAADVTAVGSILIPPMRRAGYAKEEAAAITAASASMGILVPPCLHMVILSTVIDVSVAALFTGGFLPAIAMALCLAVLIYVKARVGNWPREEKASMGRVVVTAGGAILPLTTGVIIIGGIFSGMVTLTESAVLAVIYSAVLAMLVYRGVSVREFWRLTVVCGTMVGMVMWVVANAILFGWLITSERIPHQLAAAISQVSTSPAFFLGLTVLLYLVFSGLLEGLAALLIFSAVLWPIGQALGVDVVHFGIVSIAAMGLGWFLPPAGLGLVLASTIAESTVMDTAKSFVPYMLVLAFGIGLLVLFPEVTLVLPRFLGTAKP